MLTGPEGRLARLISDDLLGLPHQIVHGDYSADQVLIDDAGVSLIDWDRMGLGPGVIDLGRFAATMTMADLVAGTETAEELMAPVIEAYAAASRSDPRPHMPASSALALLELACEPFRRRAVGWSDLLVRAVRTASDLCGAPIHHA